MNLAKKVGFPPWKKLKGIWLRKVNLTKALKIIGAPPNPSETPPLKKILILVKSSLKIALHNLPSKAPLLSSLIIPLGSNSSNLKIIRKRVNNW